nr:pedal peptide [Tritonia tetraquetra]
PYDQITGAHGLRGFA